MTTSFVFNQEELLRFALYRQPFQRSASAISVVSLDNANAFQVQVIAARHAADQTAIAALNDPAAIIEVAFAESEIRLEVKLAGLAEKIRLANCFAANELNDLAPGFHIPSPTHALACRG